MSHSSLLGKVHITASPSVFLLHLSFPFTPTIFTVMFLGHPQEPSLSEYYFYLTLHSHPAEPVQKGKEFQTCSPKPGIISLAFISETFLPFLSHFLINSY